MSAFSRMQHVLSTTTSADSASVVASMPSDSSIPAMRSESCTFIWQPKVRTKYFFLTSSVIVSVVVALLAGRRFGPLGVEMFELARLDANVVEEDVEIGALHADDAADLVGGNLTFVDQAIERAQCDAQALRCFLCAEPGDLFHG